MLSVVGALLFLLAPQALAWSPGPPAFAPINVVPQVDLRLFLNAQQFSFLAESTGRLEAGGVRNIQLTLGSYYQPWDFLRFGAFYRRQWGVRHDSDWQFPSTQWEWIDVNSRGEDVLVLDATPRVLLPFLPGSDWVGELRVRYEFNTFGSLHTLLFRPGIKYFILEDGQPRWQFYGQFEAYVPLNYGRSFIYETWTYLGAMRFFAPWVQVGLYTSLRSRNWGSTAFYTANTAPASTFLITEWSWMIGLNAIFQISF